MYIKELQLFGFKSFQEKANLQLAPGLNCIIGPNGCGKSNVLDALRWVLGEQSFSVLRCTKNEDLIFAGTTRTGPLNYAEVRLVLATEDRPELGSEVEIRRRFFRSGESEYYLNRQPCRLRDIQELFFAAGIGTKAYSIFDRRQMEEIIAGNIRQMFDEAAALAKFRDAKEECQRKLELTKTDLTRLEDIIAERERVVRSLQRQAAKLRAYHRLKEEEKQLRLLELKGSYEELQRALVQARAELAELEQAEAERLREIKRLEAELRSLHNRLVDVEGEREKIRAEIQRYRTALAELQTREMIERKEVDFLTKNAAAAREEQDRLKKEIAQLEELFTTAATKLEEKNQELERSQRMLERLQVATKENEEQLFRFRREEAMLKERLHPLLEEEQRLQRTKVRLEAETTNTEGALERVMNELNEVRVRLIKEEEEWGRAQAEVKAIRDKAEKCRQRFGALEAELKNGERRQEEIRRVRAGLMREKALLEQDLAGLIARLAQEELREAQKTLGRDRLKEVAALLLPDPGWERACEAALYPVIDFLVGKGVAPAELTALGEKGARGRFGFILTGFEKKGQFDDPVFSDERVIGKLGDFVRLDADAPPVLKETIDSFFVVRDQASFLTLIAEYPERRFVSQGGLAWFGDGKFIAVGADAGRLTAMAGIKQRQERVAELERELQRLQEEESALTTKRVALQRELEEVEGERAVVEQERVRQESAVATMTALRDELRRDEERLVAEKARLEGLLGRLREKFGEVEGQQKGLGESISGIDKELRWVAAEAEKIETQAKVQLQELTEALAGVTEIRAKIERLEVESGHLRAQIEERRQRVAERAGVIIQADERTAEMVIREKEWQQERERIEQELRKAEAQLEQFGAPEIARAAEELEQNIAELRTKQQQGQKIILDRRVNIAELEARERAIVEEAQADYQMDISTFVAEASPGFAERLLRIRQRLEVLGQVNPLAAEEYEGERRDLERLLSQRADVVQAKENLERSLTEIDRHAREQFLATYQEVREQFRQIFKELFLEGEADLILMDSANPLASDIGIVAKPRGKNPKRLEQLSDGEKAMLAVSLLFAFYRVKPAPFCFLDEVDAPLDDANVARFADYLKRLSERTQVVVITHNRLTVERADVIFGVTAEEPGVSKLVSVSLAEYREKTGNRGDAS